MAVAVCAAFPALAHGEQVLVLPASLGLLLVPALAVIAIPWHRWWGRVIVAVTLLGSNVALWFVPAVVPQTAGGIATANMTVLILSLLGIPIICATVVALVLLQFGRHRTA